MSDIIKAEEMRATRTADGHILYEFKKHLDLAWRRLGVMPEYTLPMFHATLKILVDEAPPDVHEMGFCIGSDSENWQFMIEMSLDRVSEFVMCMEKLAVNIQDEKPVVTLPKSNNN